MRIGTSKMAWPFSRTQIVETLLNAGATSKQATNTAKKIEQELYRKKLELVTPKQLKKIVVQVVKQQISNKVAEAITNQTPVFADLVVQGERGESPFSRTILARTLEDVGLTSLETHAVANTLDAQLRKQGMTKISIQELHQRVDHLLLKLHGEHVSLMYRYIQQNQGRLGVVNAEGGMPVPFSKGILVQSLLAAGVAPDVARKVVRITLRDLRGEEDRVIRQRVIREKVETLLLNEVGADVSARYRLLRVIRHPPRPIIVLLGGVSGTGKSFLASELAYRLAISRVVSTDSIREVMRAMVSPALLPTLHASTFSAWEALIPPEQSVPERPSEELLMAGFREQVQQVSVGLDAVVNRSIEEGASLVLEGVHLVPGYLRAAEDERAIVIPMLITLPSESEHRAHFEHRDQQTAASRPLHHYMRYFTEIREMQEELQQLAEAQEVPLLDGFTLDESVDQAIDAVLRYVFNALTSEEREELLGQEYEDLTLEVTETE